jgi:hypothetical protein
VFLAAVAPQLAGNVRETVPAAGAPAQAAGPSAAESERCKVPDFAKALGHEQMWKLHNNCK